MLNILNRKNSTKYKTKRLLLLFLLSHRKRSEGINYIMSVMLGVSEGNKHTHTSASMGAVDSRQGGGGV